MDIDIFDSRSKTLLKSFKFIFKITYLDVSFECLYFLNDNEPSNQAFIDDFFLIFVFYFLFGCYYLFLKIQKKPSKIIIHNFKILCYIILPIVIRKIADCLAFKQINGQYLLKSNTNLIMSDVSYAIGLFFIPNVLLFFFILFRQNFYSPTKSSKKGKKSDFSFPDIVHLGLKNYGLYELLNLLTLLFMFLINIIDIEVDIKIPIIAFFFFYRIIFELMICKFLSSKYQRINFNYKLIFIFDYLILLFLNTDYFVDWVYPFLIIEMTWFVYFLIGLILFFFGNQKIYRQNTMKLYEKLKLSISLKTKKHQLKLKIPKKAENMQKIKQQTF